MPCEVTWASPKILRSDLASLVGPAVTDYRCKPMRPWTNFRAAQRSRVAI